MGGQSSASTHEIGWRGACRQTALNFRHSAAGRRPSIPLARSASMAVAISWQNSSPTSTRSRRHPLRTAICRCAHSDRRTRRVRRTRRRCHLVSRCRRGLLARRSIHAPIPSPSRSTRIRNASLVASSGLGVLGNHNRASACLCTIGSVQLSLCRKKMLNPDLLGSIERVRWAASAPCDGPRSRHLMTNLIANPRRRFQHKAYAGGPSPGWLSRSLFAVSMPFQGICNGSARRAGLGYSGERPNREAAWPDSA